MKKNSLNSKKTVLMVGWFFYPKVGGVETLMLNMAKRFATKGYRVAMLTSLIDGSQEYEELGEVKVYRKAFLRPDISFSAEVIEKEFGDILTESQADIVHFHNGSYPSATTDMENGVKKILAMFSLIKGLGIKVIEHSHNAQLKAPEITKPLRYLPWDYLICVSGFVKNKWDEFGNSVKREVVIYNGVDVAKYHKIEPAVVPRLGEPGSALRIFFPARIVSMSTGEISRQKNFLLVLKACKMLKARGINNFQLVAVHNKSLVEKKCLDAYNLVDQFIKQNKLADNVFFLSEVDPSQMPSYYAAMDVVCVPSLNETFGLVYLEAMASGKIAIASNTGAPQEYIINGKNGFLVSPDDPLELAYVLRGIINHKTNIKRLTEEAWKTAQHYTLERMAQGVEEVYKELLGEK